MAKTLLIIGAGPLQVSAYTTARRLGIRSVAVDRNESAPGMLLADMAYPVDTRDVASIIEIAKAEHVGGVLTLCTDAPVVAVAAVAKALKLDALSPEAAACATNKSLMRDAFAAAGTPIPNYRRAFTLEEARTAAREIAFPIILKPPASSGSRGIVKVLDESTLAKDYDYTRNTAGPACEILVEEFVEGDEVSVETLSFGGQHVVLAITDKRTTGDPYWVESGHVEPSRLSETKQRAIRETAVAGLQALGVMNAAGHVEIKIGSHGPRLIELGARLGGDFITTELVLRSTGIDMVEGIIRMALGETPEVKPTKRAGAAIRYILPPTGVIQSIHGLDRAREMVGVARLELNLIPGSHFKGVFSSLDRPGFVIAEGKDASEAEERAKAACDQVAFRLVGN